MGIHEIFKNKITHEMYLCEDVEQNQKNKLSNNVINALISCKNHYTKQLETIFLEILSNMNVDFPQFIESKNLKWYMEKLPELIQMIAIFNYSGALQVLVSAFSENKWKIEKQYSAIVLAQNLSAILRYEEEYIYFSKLLINWFINNNQFGQANKLLSEWELILGDDEEMMELRRKLTQLH